ncbi:MAG: NERD domain-containing protein [Eggerthellaceae bacterium]|nr:NERD domain-containing protein [Eggerthellaceae bacterium]
MGDCIDERDGRVDARDEARAIAERIGDLRAQVRNLALAAENERESGSGVAEGTPEAGYSEFIVADFEERAAACGQEIGWLRKRHDEIMGPYSNFAIWEEEGVAECSECGSLFFLVELRGRFMARTCPLCGERVHEGPFDMRGFKLARERRRLERRGEADTGELETEIRRLAMARYLTSEWYLLSGTPTSLLGYDATQEGYSFTPDYRNDGFFCLRAEYGYAEVGGISGEMALFDSLRRCVNDPSSPLYGSKIVPNVNLVTNGSKGGRLTVMRNQTDCVLLHPEGAFVFEAKRWRSHIAVDAGRKEVRVTKRGRTRCFPAGEGPVYQVTANRKALLKRCPGLDGQRVCGVVAFVEPNSLSGDAGSLPCGGGVFFGELKATGKSGLRNPIEKCIAGWSAHPMKGGGLDVVAMAETLLSEDNRYELPIDPVGRM